MYRKETDPALSGGYCFVKDESESEYFAKETHTHTHTRRDRERHGNAITVEKPSILTVPDQGEGCKD